MQSLKLPVLALILLNIVVDCFHLKRSFKILNGHMVNEWKTNKFKFIGLLYSDGVCTASFVDKYTIITAGHCFMSRSEPPPYVMLEVIKMKPPITKFIWIAKHYVVPEFNNEWKNKAVSGNDLAVAKLAAPIDEKVYDQITLNLMAIGRPRGGIEIYFVGYGNDVNPADAQLKYGQSKIADCKSGHPGRPICAKSCAKFENQVTEYGDSGAPAVTEINKQWIGVGVLSGLVGYTNGAQEMIFAASGSHYDFIKKHAGADVK